MTELDYKFQVNEVAIQMHMCEYVKREGLFSLSVAHTIACILLKLLIRNMTL